MPEVKIALSAFDRLQKHAKRLGVPVSEVIQRALNEFDSAQNGSENAQEDRPKRSRPPARPQEPRSAEPSKKGKESKNRPAKPQDSVHENKGRDLVKRIDPKNIPPLKHTEVVKAKINGKWIEEPNWNKLVRQLIVRALRKKISVEEIKGMCSANVVAGKRDVEGFKPIEGVDASYQNLSSNPACKTILILAKRLNAEVDIGIIWEDKLGAKFPGQRRRLLFNRKPGARSSVHSSGGRR